MKYARKDNIAHSRHNISPKHELLRIALHSCECGVTLIQEPLVAAGRPSNIGSDFKPNGAIMSRSREFTGILSTELKRILGKREQELEGCFRPLLTYRRPPSGSPRRGAADAGNAPSPGPSWTRTESNAAQEQTGRKPDALLTETCVGEENKSRNANNRGRLLEECGNGKGQTQHLQVMQNSLFAPITVKYLS